MMLFIHCQFKKERRTIPVNGNGDVVNILFLKKKATFLVKPFKRTFQNGKGN